MAGFVVSRCRRCKGRIVWAKTKAGRTMPVDADPHPDGNVVLRADLSGPPVAEVHTEPAGPGEERRKVHFATCLRPRGKFGRSR